MDRETTGVASAMMDMTKSLTGVFKKYTRQTRTKAWNKLTSKDGEKEIQKYIQDPSRSINTIRQLAFKEWFKDNS